MTLYLAVNKADYFIYGCNKLFIGTDHKPLVAFFGKVDPKPLDKIVNKRLRKYVSEINALRFTIFHILGAKKSHQIEGLDSQVVGLVMTKESLLKVQRSQTVQSNQFLLAQMLGSACGQMPADLPAYLPAYLPAECPQFTHFLPLVQVVQLLIRTF